MFTLQQAAARSEGRSWSSSRRWNEQYVNPQDAWGSAPNNWKWISGLKIAQKVEETEDDPRQADDKTHKTNGGGVEKMLTAWIIRWHGSHHN